MVSEPVRGSLPAPAFYALPGIERARLYHRDQAPRTPIHHLTGIRITQVVNGSVVITVPVSPWFAHPNGDFNAIFPASTALELAALTVAPPATHIVSRTLQYSQLRTFSPDNRLLVGRGSVIHTTRTMAFVEARVEDAEGRLVAHATGHVAMVPIDPPPQPGALPPVEHPTYPSPDPHQRPVPPETVELFDAFATYGWMQTWKPMAEGVLPTAPLHKFFGVRDLSVEGGRVSEAFPASPWFQGIDPQVLSGVLGGLMLDVCGGASLTRFEPGSDVAILAASTRYLRGIPADGRELRVGAGAVKHSDQTVAIDCELVDDEGVVAQMAATGIPIPIRTQARRIAPEPILTTVLFTDIVGSTDAADRMGDAQWTKVLEAHRGIVRAELEHFGGREVNTTGDGFVATFDSPSRAVECARVIRDGVRRVGIEIRAGIHTGECEIRGRDIAGTAVNLAARIEAAAAPGEVWMSNTVRELIAGSAIAVDDRGPHELKGIPGEVWLYSVKESST